MEPALLPRRLARGAGAPCTSAGSGVIASGAINAFPSVSPNAAGLDMRSEEIWACIPEDRHVQPARSFGTLTPGLYALADGLGACHMETGRRKLLLLQDCAIELLVLVGDMP
jgi:hypothetical protein